MMMSMNVCITFATVMSTKVIGSSHNSCLEVYDNNIHKVRNVLVPFDADDVVIICVFLQAKENDDDSERMHNNYNIDDGKIYWQ
jgi:hypothetical protein